MIQEEFDLLSDEEKLTACLNFNKMFNMAIEYCARTQTLDELAAYDQEIDI